MRNITATRISKKIALDIPITIFNRFPEFPTPADDCLSAPVGSAGEVGEDIGAGDSFFWFGLAGNDPLLLLGGEMMPSAGVGAPLLGGRAMRLLDCSTSTRRTLLTCISMFGMTPASGESSKPKKNYLSNSYSKENYQFKGKNK